MNLFQLFFRTILFIPVFVMLLNDAGQARPPSPTGQPNIIHILADDVGYEDLSCYGGKDIHTSNLDRLAAEGLRFTNYYAPHGTGTASRGAILTGRISPRLNDGEGLSFHTPGANTGLDPNREISIAGMLKARGYNTGMIGNWDLGHLPGRLPVNHGFDFFLGIPYSHEYGPERKWGTGSDEYTAIPLMRDTVIISHNHHHDLAWLPALFGQEACRFIRKNALEEQPFYLLYAPVETHAPWLIPSGFEGGSGKGPYEDAVSYLDHTVGMILRSLQELGIEQNTLIVFSSANGPRISRDPELEACYGKFARIDSTRKYQLRGGKSQSRYEGGIRVPCIMRWPAVLPQGFTMDMIAAGYDLFATFADAATVSIPSGRIIDGKNLLPVLTGADQEPLHLLFFGFEPDGMLMSVRYKNWKLVVPSDSTAGAPIQTGFELYQLNTDRGERNDVASRFPEIVDQLRQFGEKAKKAIRENTRLPERNFIE